MRRPLLSFSLLAAVALVATLREGAAPAAPDAEASRSTAADGPPVASARAAIPGDAPLSEAREAAILDAGDAVAVAYREDLLMVRVAEGVDVTAVAAAHRLAVLRAPGRSGFAALGRSSGAPIGEALDALRADPRVTQVAPQAIVRGAGSKAASYQQRADKEWAKAEQLEQVALDQEARASALTDAGASEDEVARAESDAADARYRADKQWRKAEQAQDKATRTAERERTAQIRELQLQVKTCAHPKYSGKESTWDDYAEPDMSGVVIAVLDTGVAYADRMEGGVQHVAAASLSASRIVAPIDLVNGDLHPGDDHQHGTHIASIIASDGDVVGLAPGASLMPVKVLDARNSGTELELVEGIHHAIDHGADLINMSLSFGAGYVPSPALREALERAHTAGVVMVAAAGNNAAEDVSWPAASRRVLAVGSAGIDASRDLVWAPYANHSAQVDLTAVGGILGRDADGDGFDDGVLAETIAPGDPTRVGLWFAAGSSQAAAVVTGSIARMMSLGVPPADAARVLQATANTDLDGDPFLSGWGAGTPNLLEAEALWEEDDEVEEIAHPGDRFVSVHPWVASESDGKKKRAHAAFTVVDERGAPVEDVEVVGRVTGSQSEQFSCKTDDDGTCQVELDDVETEDERGRAFDPGLVWAWEVHGLLEEDELMTRPGALLFATDGLERLAAAMDADASLADASLAVYWPEGEDDELGDVAESFVVLSGGAGISTSPFGLALTPAALAGVATVEDARVDLDGSGISTSPLGLLPARLVRFDGSGISTSPLGFELPPLLAVDGSRITTSPLGLHPLAFTQPMDGSGISTSPLGYASEPILLDRAEIVGADVEGALADRIAAGGWATVGGYAPVDVLQASGLLALPSAELTDALGADAGVGDEVRGAGWGEEVTEFDLASLPAATE